MPPVDLTVLAPFLALAAGIAVLLLSIAWRRSPGTALAVTLTGLAAALAALALAQPYAALRVQQGGFLRLDLFALFFMALVLVSTGAVAILAGSYLGRIGGRQDEFHLLLLLAALGGCTLAAADNYVALFLALELLSLSLYGLVGYWRTHAPSIEAAFKYLVLASVSTAFLLFGAALLYADNGNLGFNLRYTAVPDGLLPGGVGMPSLLGLAGLTLVLVGAAFKLALAPFHVWAADVYQGAPAPVTAFVATASKAAAFAVLCRVLSPLPAVLPAPVLLLFTLLAVFSMFAGNLLALLQDNLKRLLAYSSIAHLGYLTVALVAGGMDAAAFYLVAYSAAALGAFGVVGVLSGPGGEAESLADYRGLAWRRPWLAAVLACMLFSLAGIPLTAGFLAKVFVAGSALGAGLRLLPLLLVLNSALGVYYYLRVVVVLFRPAEGIEEDLRQGEARRRCAPRTALPERIVLALLALATLALGIYPAPFLELIRACGP